MTLDPKANFVVISLPHAETFLAGVGSSRSIVDGKPRPKSYDAGRNSRHAARYKIGPPSEAKQSHKQMAPLTASHPLNNLVTIRQLYQYIGDGRMAKILFPVVHSRRTGGPDVCHYPSRIEPEGTGICRPLQLDIVADYGLCLCVYPSRVNPACPDCHSGC